MGAESRARRASRREQRDAAGGAGIIGGSEEVGCEGGRAGNPANAPCGLHCLLFLLLLIPWCGCLVCIS